MSRKKCMEALIGHLSMQKLNFYQFKNMNELTIEHIYKVKRLEATYSSSERDAI